MSNQTNQRIIKDYEDFKKNKPLGGIGGPINGDLKHWEVTIPGPPGTPFEEGKFKIDIKLDDNYPNSKPDCHFVTKVFHPNIKFTDGSICVKLLNSWTSKNSSICGIVVALYGLLKDPNQISPLNGNANDLYTKDPIRYNQLAKAFTNKFAK